MNRLIGVFLALLLSTHLAHGNELINRLFLFSEPLLRSYLLVDEIDGSFSDALKFMKQIEAGESPAPVGDGWKGIVEKFEAAASGYRLTKESLWGFPFASSCASLAHAHRYIH